MKSPNLNKALLALCLAIPSMLLASSQIETVKTIGVRGDVTIQNVSTGQVARLKQDQTFAEGTTVRTGENSSATIMFSTGTFIAVPSNTTFTVTNFEQTDFDASKGAFETLKVEPSVSDLRIELTEGRITGQTAKLSPESNLEINTVAGDVEITGTTWDITVTNASNGSVTLNIANLTGVVTYTFGGTFTSVQAGDFIQIAFGGDQAAGEVSISGGHVNELDLRAIFAFLIADLENSDVLPANFPSALPYDDVVVISAER